VARRSAAALLALLLCMTLAAAADWPLTIIDLRHRLPEEVIPMLAPLAGPDGVVTGANASLFVRASPERLADLRAALARIDQPARNLLVEVRHRSAASAQGRGLAISVDEPIGEDGRIRAGSGRGTGLRANAGSGDRSRDLVQQVRVVDGGQAYIAVGEERPVGWREVTPTPNGMVRRGGVGYASAGSGFYVRPRVQAERVTVMIASGVAHFDGPRGAGVVRGSGLDTRVSGRLGEWIPLGGVGETRSRQQRGLSGWGEDSAAATSGLEIRVLPLD
jgi:hypothetical protein